jgi:hypothetical protein
VVERMNLEKYDLVLMVSVSEVIKGMGLELG